ncbi:PIN-like domain-containing protein [Aureispira anguillae]|uniref:PIN-like domain-containing protein n=1 Tax=Aureispira anguillae TaxID=2864201 RepID=A0A915YI54_9BACT|nr:PIN-like domain-containing protein [Aureispira anguillae]BDS13444.1 PIN-like domain-containing protein [Aureispira anguillae]
MSKNKQEIGSDFSYGAQVNQQNKDIRQNCVALYKEGLAAAKNLAENCVVFLDTNVLLAYYQMPIAARFALYDFLEKNKDRVYVCDQVSREYAKHKNKVRRIYGRQLVLKRPTAYQQELGAKIIDFLEENGDVLAAYPNFRTRLEKVYQESAHILTLLKQTANERIKACKKALHQKDLEDLLPQLQTVEALTKKEFKFIKQEFDHLSKDVDNVDQKKFATKVAAYLYQYPHKVFPGIGDIDKKPKNPYGDYCIFHELMKWSANAPQKRPLIFLTNDVTKSDWVDINKQAYVHYLENFYQNTGDIFYILHAEEIFSTILGQSCAHLVTPTEIWEDAEADVLAKNGEQLTIQNLQKLLEALYPYRTTVEEPNDFWIELIADLTQNFEIDNLLQLKIDLLEHYHLLVEVELRRYQIYDQVDAMEVTLELIYE